LSTQLKCHVFVVLNHDDDILWYALYDQGDLVDEYDSSPGYFEMSDEPSPPEGGDARQLCATFGGDPVAVEKILRTSMLDDSAYVFAVERHQELVTALGISDYAVGTSFESFDNDELPEDLTIEQVIET